MKGPHGLPFLGSPGDKASSSSSRVQVGCADGDPPTPVLVPFPLSLSLRNRLGLSLTCITVGTVVGLLTAVRAHYGQAKSHPCCRLMMTVGSTSFMLWAYDDRRVPPHSCCRLIQYFSKSPHPFLLSLISPAVCLSP